MKRTLPLLLLLAALQALAQTPLRKGKDYAVFFYVTQFQPGWPALPETADSAPGSCYGRVRRGESRVFAHRIIV
ncbi:MAG: hypothetical protein JNK89_02810 [Saprospiraceae bacterium]|nr:hypothetical protein [Saprospiraceae bacterium]